jgi:hypothetical protein
MRAWSLDLAIANACSKRARTWTAGIERALSHVQRTLRDDRTLGLGSFVQVLRSGFRLGRIFRPTPGGYRFYTGEDPTPSRAAREDADLDRLKEKILEKYGRA